MRAPDITWSAVTWQRGLPSAQAVDLMARLAAQPGSPPVLLEIRTQGGSIVSLLGTTQKNARRLGNLVRELAPETQLSPAPARSPVSTARELRVSDTALRLGPEHPTSSIAAAVHAALAVVRSGEVLALQVVLKPGLRPTVHDQPTPSIWQSLGGGAPSASATLRTAIRSKHAQHGFSGVIRVGVAAEEQSRRASLGMGLVGALRLAEGPGLRLNDRPVRPSALNDAQTPLRWPLRLSAAEVVTMAGLPIDAETLPGLPPPHPRRLPATAVRDGDLVLARSTAPGTLGAPIGFATPSLRTHLHALGQTGTGKSTQLQGMLIQLMDRGHGVILVEPKSDLAEGVLARVPVHRRRDVVVLDPTDPRPVGLNPLARGSRTTPEQVADSVLAIFSGMYARGDLGPRTTDILYAATLTLAKHENTSLTMIPRLLSNTVFRRQMIGEVISADPHGIGSFWAWFHSISDAERNSAIAPLMNKLRPILMREQVRSVLGQTHPRFDISQVFTENKILIVPLNKGLLGAESAHWIGSLLVARIWETLLAQAAVPAGQRPTVVIALDEFQDYTHLGTDLGEALSQARALGGAFILNHQYLDQLPAPTKEAVLSHARSRVVFTPSHKDAPELARMTGGQLQVLDFTSLGQYEVYLDLQRDGRSSGWVSGRTEAPAPSASDPAELRRYSRDKFGARASEPEPGGPSSAPQRPDAPAKVGKRRRSS